MKNKNWLIVIILAIVTFLLGMLSSSIIGRKTEAKMISKANVEIKDFESRNEIWGKNYPREYQSWKRTEDTTFRSKHMSSDNDDVLAQRPEMVILWAGYGFSKDYAAPRGHMHAIEDMRKTLRTGAPSEKSGSPMPGTCWTCKSPDVPRVMHEEGIENFYKPNWAANGEKIVNPIGCADCHDPKTMNLTITRPALVEAFNRQGKDITQATHQEMRSLVCAQCHVEYYFKGKGKYLTFPWDKGGKMEDVERYYDEANYADYTHKLSRVPVLKAQHPDFELFSLGIHAQRGVSCADCHMPYKSEGGIKYTDHHITSPLANVNSTCQVCHRESEETLVKNVYERQDVVFGLRNKLEKELAKAHLKAKFMWDNGAKEEDMKNILQLIRKSQFRWDYITASHGASFHAPLESQRVLSDGLYYVMQADNEMNLLKNKMAIAAEFVMPDISTKAKAQKVAGLDMEKLEKEKKRFLKEVVPVWVKKAKENGILVSK